MHCFYSDVTVFALNCTALSKLVLECSQWLAQDFLNVGSNAAESPDQFCNVGRVVCRLWQSEVSQLLSKFCCFSEKNWATFYAI